MGSRQTPAQAARLPTGRGPRSHGEVNELQRARIVSAMIEVTAEGGYVNAAVASIVARAGVSRRTFYELFEGREDCFLVAFDWAVEQLREVALEGYRSQRSWREGIRHGLAALLRLLDSEPELARFGVIEALGAGPAVLERRAGVVGKLIEALSAGAPRPLSSSGMPRLVAEGAVGGAFAIVHGRLLCSTRGAATPLIELHGALMGTIVLPYLGPRTARAESERPAPPEPARKTGARHVEGRRLLARLDMRLTYRTVRCLLFIRENPGVSNREVTVGAGVPDEGQTSKLLRRLAKLDLLANDREHGPGFPNRWTLTANGERVLAAVQNVESRP